MDDTHHQAVPLAGSTPHKSRRASDSASVYSKSTEPADNSGSILDDSNICESSKSFPAAEESRFVLEETECSGNSRDSSRDNSISVMETQPILFNIKAADQNEDEDEEEKELNEDQGLVNSPIGSPAVNPFYDSDDERPITPTQKYQTTSKSQSIFNDSDESDSITPPASPSLDIRSVMKSPSVCSSQFDSCPLSAKPTVDDILEIGTSPTNCDISTDSEKTTPGSPPAFSQQIGDTTGTHEEVLQERNQSPQSVNCENKKRWPALNDPHLSTSTPYPDVTAQRDDQMSQTSQTDSIVPETQQDSPPPDLCQSDDDDLPGGSPEKRRRMVIRNSEKFVKAKEAATATASPVCFRRKLPSPLFSGDESEVADGMDVDVSIDSASQSSNPAPPDSVSVPMDLCTPLEPTEPLEELAVASPAPEQDNLTVNEDAVQCNRNKSEFIPVPQVNQALTTVELYENPLHSTEPLNQLEAAVQLTPPVSKERAKRGKALRPSGRRQEAPVHTAPEADPPIIKILQQRTTSPPPPRRSNRRTVPNPRFVEIEEQQKTEEDPSPIVAPKRRGRPPKNQPPVVDPEPEPAQRHERSREEEETPPAPAPTPTPNINSSSVVQKKRASTADIQTEEEVTLPQSSRRRERRNKEMDKQPPPPVTTTVSGRGMALPQIAGRTTMGPPPKRGRSKKAAQDATSLGSDSEESEKSVKRRGTQSTKKPSAIIDSNNSSDCSNNNETDSPAASAAEASSSSRRRKRALAGPVRVLFTGLDDDSLALHSTSVIKLGGRIVDNPRQCSVLVTDKIRRTVKFLCAVGLGLPIVDLRWLQESLRKGKFIDPWNFLLLDKEGEAKFDFSLQETLRASEKPVFAGWSIAATPSVKPSPTELKEIIESGSGTFVEELPSKSLDGNLVVISSADDRKSSKKWAKEGFKVAQVESVLIGVLRHSFLPEQFTI